MNRLGAVQVTALALKTVLSGPQNAGGFSPPVTYIIGEAASLSGLWPGFSPQASESLKQGVRYTIMRMEQRDAAGMVDYYWSTIIGTERSIGFAAKMREEGFSRFEGGAGGVSRRL